MTDLDTLARAAATELLDRTTPDVSGRYAELRRVRARRTAAKLVGVVAAVAVAAGGWRLAAGGDGRVEPAPPPSGVHNGDLIGIDWDAPGDMRWWTLIEGEGPAPSRPDDLGRYARVRFTPDGSSLLYPDREGRVVATRLRDGHREVLADCPEPDYCEASLSPDGRVVAISDHGGVRLQRVGATRSELLSIDGADFTASPSWSSDGTEIAFSTEDGVFVAAADGSSVRAVHLFAQRGWYYVPVSWSPDGSRIAFFDLERWGDKATGGNLYRYNVEFTAMTARPDGSDPRVLHRAGRCFCTKAPQPALAWSPDSSLVAVSTTLRAQPGAYVVQPDGTGWHQVGSGYYDAFAWQPVID
ncbi:MAG TPA: hypothetical protein VFV89_03830 [Nocardioides sp.]|uniref:TolB family protein n=1 Tax=Nocardioides sp. TaxID=35761 RepID=UPI002E353435|nr:hypothetical protein [Nocardioides sp.]HEX5086912.1 hypothetical protein [Nocardioides sp.]